MFPEGRNTKAFEGIIAVWKTSQNFQLQNAQSVMDLSGLVRESRFLMPWVGRHFLFRRLLGIGFLMGAMVLSMRLPGVVKRTAFWCLRCWVEVSLGG